MQLLLDYFKIPRLHKNPILIIGNSTSALFKELDLNKFEDNQLILIQFSDDNLDHESDIQGHQNKVNIDLNFFKDGEYNKERLAFQIQRFFEVNKEIWALAKINIVISLDELIGQEFIEALLVAQQNQNVEINLYVRKPLLGFQNILAEVETYFQKCYSHFKNVVQISFGNTTELYSIVKTK
jgi:hypothetical protein